MKIPEKNTYMVTKGVLTQLRVTDRQFLPDPTMEK